MQETKFPMFQRLSAPDAQTWNGGRITDTDILTLSEAASMASKQAGQDVSVSDFLRAAARGEILMMGITKKSSKTEPCTAGDALLNDGKPVPEGCLINLPLEACQGLANVGRASWRILFDRWQLTQDEPDFLTLPADCRVSGEATRALAAAFTERLQAVEPDSEITERASSAPAIDYSLLATREQLIEAFGRFTGMDATWFDNLKDKPALWNARKVEGQGGRGHVLEPLFCPFEVMQWLASSKRRTGRSLGLEKAWELLERNFPKVYNSNSVADPRTND